MQNCSRPSDFSIVSSAPRSGRKNLVVTAKRMFARCVRTVVATYAVDDDDAEDEIRRLKQILSTARA